MFSLSNSLTSPDMECKPSSTNLCIGKAGSGENVSNSQAIAQVTPELAVPAASGVQVDMEIVLDSAGSAPSGVSGVSGHASPSKFGCGFVGSPFLSRSSSLSLDGRVLSSPLLPSGSFYESTIYQLLYKSDCRSRLEHQLERCIDWGDDEGMTFYTKQLEVNDPIMDIPDIVERWAPMSYLEDYPLEYFKTWEDAHDFALKLVHSAHPKRWPLRTEDIIEGSLSEVAKTLSEGNNKVLAYMLVPGVTAKKRWSAEINAVKRITAETASMVELQERDLARMSPTLRQGKEGQQIKLTIARLQLVYKIQHSEYRDLVHKFRRQSPEKHEALAKAKVFVDEGLLNAHPDIFFRTKMEAAIANSVQARKAADKKRHYAQVVAEEEREAAEYAARYAAAEGEGGSATDEDDDSSATATSASVPASPVPPSPVHVDFARAALVGSALAESRKSEDDSNSGGSHDSDEEFEDVEDEDVEDGASHATDAQLPGAADSPTRHVRFIDEVIDRRAAAGLTMINDMQAPIIEGRDEWRELQADMKRYRDDGVIMKRKLRRLNANIDAMYEDYGVPLRRLQRDVDSSDDDMSDVSE